jgi:Ca-activated chloride channel homolog
MRRSLVTLAALFTAGAAVSSSAPAAPGRTPADPVVFRPECFGAPQADGRFLQAAPGRAGAAQGASRPATSAPPPPPPSPGPATGQVLTEDFLDDIPAGRSYQSAVQTESAATTSSSKPSKPSKSGGGGGKGSKKSKEPSAPSAPPTEMPVAAPEAEAEPGWVGGDAGPADMELKANEASAYDEDDRESERKEVSSRDRADRGPVLDWGATVYLSNDDSMSLASAQRLLYAAMNRLPFTVSEIRPHELLNYFSFDTVTPDADQRFDVLASAEQDGEKLSVALAVKGASTLRQALDLTVVVDRSCSMEDEGRMDYTKRGLSLMSDQLEPGDRLDVVLFDDAVCVPLENYVVGRDDPALLQQTLASMQPEGATDVGLGLRTAYDVQKRHTGTHGRNRRVMVITDALMNTGDVDPNTVSEIGRAYDTDGIRLTGVGVGRQFDDKVLDMLTEKGKGAYVFLGSDAVVDRVFGSSGFDQLVQTIAHDVHFALKLPDSLAMERFYGEESSTVKEDVQPIHYASGTTQLFLQDLVIKDGRPVKGDAVELEITYRDATTGEPEVRRFRTTVGAMLSADPHNVRKGLALMAWTDMLTEQAMGGDPCRDPLARYAARAAKLPSDAEVAFVNGLVQDRCGAFELPRVVTDVGGVPFKVRVDADIPISTVALACPGLRTTEALSGSDVVAMFTVPPGACDLTLSGTVDMTAKVEVPSTGGGLRCVVRGGRLSCS